VRFESKTIFFYLKNALAYHSALRCSCKFKSRRTGSWKHISVRWKHFESARKVVEWHRWTKVP
jgi:hypothetical protein